MIDTPPERIWRLEMVDPHWLEEAKKVYYFDAPGSDIDLDDLVEYVRKDVMDKTIQETLWQCHGVRM